jgi:hypothetical protein
MQRELEQVQQAEASPAAGRPAVPMPSIWRTIRNYVLWSYERGSIHYDIMVTLILLFIFVTPIFVNFKDKPVPHDAHPTAVLVISDGQNGLIYQVPAAAVAGGTDAAVRAQLLQVLEPIAGPAGISNYEKTRDAAGEPVYKVWLKK